MQRAALRDGTGYVTVEDIQYALKEKLGYSIDKRENTLAKFVHQFADQSGDGRVTKKDFEILCEQMNELECEAAPVADKESEILGAGKMGLVATMDGLNDEEEQIWQASPSEVGAGVGAGASRCAKEQQASSCITIVKNVERNIEILDLIFIVCSC